MCHLNELGDWSHKRKYPRDSSIFNLSHILLSSEELSRFPQHGRLLKSVPILEESILRNPWGLPMQGMWAKIPNRNGDIQWEFTHFQGSAPFHLGNTWSVTLLILNQWGVCGYTWIFLEIVVMTNCSRLPRFAYDFRWQNSWL